MKLTQSLVAIAAISTISFAGGDINPVTVFEQEPVFVPVEAPVVPAPVVKAPVVKAPPPPAPVVAKPSGLYVAGGVTSIAINPDDRANFFSDDENQDRQIGLTGRIGYDFMDYLGAELRGTYGVAEEKTDKFKQVGGYLKPNYDLTDELNLYGLIGASKTNVGVGSTTGLSYGAGLDYGVSDKISVFTDVVNYMKKSDTDSQWGLTLGAGYAF